MSHHGIHMIPGLIPFERPLKLEQKRRRRKVSDQGDGSDAEEIDDSGAVTNAAAFAPVSASGNTANSASSGATLSLPATLKNMSRPPIAGFNQKVMGVLLQAQEKGKKTY